MPNLRPLIALTFDCSGGPAESENFSEFRFRLRFPRLRSAIADSAGFRRVSREGGESRLALPEVAEVRGGPPGGNAGPWPALKAFFIDKWTRPALFT